MFKSFDEPSLPNAIGLLRDRSQWPTDFGPWDYGNSCTCAMGLFRAKWGDGSKAPNASNAAALIGITPLQAAPIFNGLGRWQGYGAPGHVTPELVADALEKLLVE